MIFASVDKDVTSRLRQVEAYLRFIEEAGGGAHELREDVRCAKGLFFVHLYGTFEFAVMFCTQTAIGHLNETGLRVRDLRGNVRCLALDPQFQAIEASNGKRMWDRRWTLLDDVGLSSKLAISSDLIPIPSGNIKSEQLTQLARAFGINTSLIPEPKMIGYVNELAESRMAIAHGRESPADIGQRFTLSALRERLGIIRSVCDHLIHTFEEHMAKEHYRLAPKKSRRSA